jgi:hypothetical protein
VAVAGEEMIEEISVVAVEGLIGEIQDHLRADEIRETECRTVRNSILTFQAVVADDDETIEEDRLLLSPCHRNGRSQIPARHPPVVEDHPRGLAPHHLVDADLDHQTDVVHIEEGEAEEVLTDDHVEGHRAPLIAALPVPHHQEDGLQRSAHLHLHDLEDPRDVTLALDLFLSQGHVAALHEERLYPQMMK